MIVEGYFWECQRCHCRKNTSHKKEEEFERLRKEVRKYAEEEQ